MSVNKKDIEHIFERLREGMVPERGLETFAVGTEKVMGEINRVLDLVASGEGSAKFLRGDYGCGKTFYSQLTMLRALDKDFAVSKVVVSPNDTPFYKFDQVYARIVANMLTSMTKGGAFGDCIDRWIARIEDRLIDENYDEDDPSFDNYVRERFEHELSDIATESAGADFIAVLRHYFDLKQNGNIPEAQQLLAWLGGSKNISATVKRGAGIKGEISSNCAMTYLKGVLQIVKKAGHPGLVVVVDEMETIMRMRRDVRDKSLNGLRQILDATPEFKGLLWVFTGTTDFYDSRKGVASLAPLHDRIKFQQIGGFVNIKQPQVELRAFDKERLVSVAKQLRELFNSDNNQRVKEKVSEKFITLLADKVTEGFMGDVGVVPRHFLREFVNILETSDQHQDFDPAIHYEFNIDDESILSPQERSAIHSEADTETFGDDRGGASPDNKNNSTINTLEF